MGKNKAKFVEHNQCFVYPKKGLSGYSLGLPIPSGKFRTCPEFRVKFCVREEFKKMLKCPEFYDGRFGELELRE